MVSSLKSNKRAERWDVPRSAFANTIWVLNFNIIIGGVSNWTPDVVSKNQKIIFTSSSMGAEINPRPFPLPAIRCAGSR